MNPSEDSLRRPSAILLETLRRNFSWSLAGTAAFAAAQWVLLIVLARLASPEEVGAYAYAVALVTPVFTFTNLQLRGALASDLKAVHPFADYALLRIPLSVLALLFVAIIAWRFAPIGLLPLVVLVGLSRAIDALEDLVYGLLQKHEDMKGVGLSQMLRGLGTSGLFIIGYALTHNLVVAVACMTISWLVTFGLFDILRARRVTGVAPFTARGLTDSMRRGRRVWSLARATFPLGVVVLIGALCVNVPRYVLEARSGLAGVGTFSATMQLMVPGVLVVGAMGQATAPRLARLYAEGASSTAVLVVLMKVFAVLAFGVAGIGVAMLAGGPILASVYGEEYRSSGPTLSWVMVAAAASYVSTIAGFALTAGRAFKQQVPIHLVALVVVIGCSLALVPRHGSLGAAQALAASYAVQAVGGLGVVAFRRRGHYP